MHWRRKWQPTPVFLPGESQGWGSLMEKFNLCEVHSKGDQSCVFFGRNDAKAETPVLWPPHAKSWLIGKDPDAGRDWEQEEKGTTEDEMVGWHHWLNGHGFGWIVGVGDGQGGLTCCGSWGRKESDTTEWLNWTGLQGDETSQSQRKSVLNVHWKDWCWSWNSNTLATGCEELTHWKRPWCWERLRAGGEGDDRGWDSWMASLTQWTWVWVDSGSWWWTGRPGMLRFMGSQRVGHGWVTELNWIEPSPYTKTR